jgi:dihydrofolate reductase
MGKIVVTEFITLDGVIKDPHKWSFPYWNDEIGKYKDAELKTSDALLLGRVTYEGFAAAWPGRTDDDGFADKFNSMPKYVVTTTLKKADWNNSTIISTDVVKEITKLKEITIQDIVVHGSGNLVQTLMQNNLIDLYKLLVYPIVLGEGDKLFKDGSQAKLELVETKKFDTGAVALHYQPEKK